MSRDGVIDVLNVFKRCANGFPLDIQTSDKTVFSGIDYMDNTKNEDNIYYPICRSGEVVHIAMKVLCEDDTNCLINLFCRVMDKGHLYCMRYNEEIEKNVLIYTCDYPCIDDFETLSKYIIYTNEGECIKKEEVERVIEQNSIKVVFFNSYGVNEEYGEISSYLNYLSKKYNVSVLTFYSVYRKDYKKNIKDVIPVENVCICRELRFHNRGDKVEYTFWIFEYGGLAPKRYIFQLKHNENSSPYCTAAFSFMKLLRLHNVFSRIEDWTLHRDLVKIMLGYYNFSLKKSTLDQYIDSGVRCDMLRKSKISKTVIEYRYNSEWLHSIYDNVENLKTALEKVK